jgi:aspartate 1-decarboxylase
MHITMLKAKLHRATVTTCCLDYEGSISIDADLLRCSGIRPNEQVDVYNLNNGERFTTYAIEAPAESGTIGLNGAAARKAMPGDRIIICAYCLVNADEASQNYPQVVLLDDGNKVRPSREHKY